MNPRAELRRRAPRAIALVLVLALWALPSIARADAVDDLAKVLDYTGGIPGIPVTGQDIRDSKKMFACIDKANNDVAVANCVDGALDTPLGKKAAAESGLPSWFGKLIEVYIDVRTEDWWALIEDAGMTIACAAAQVLAGGADVCGIAQAIIELAGAAKAAFDDVVAFLEDVGCAAGIACDGSTPRELLAYGLVFEPRVADGLKARKEVEGLAFPKLRGQLEQNALAHPAKLSVQSYPINEEFTKGQVDKASAAWTGAVDKQWTADMFKNVLPARSTKQIEYDTAQRVATVANATASAYLASPKSTDAHKVAVETCAVADFGTAFAFAHVDRWMQEYPAEAKKFTGLKSNHDWCAADFFGKNVAGFAQGFRDRLVATNTCVAMGPGMLCQTLANYETCVGLMKAAGQPGQCGVGAAGIGKELADKLNKYFVDERNSKYAPCRADLPDGGAPTSTKPLALVCKRPTLQHFCKQKLADLWKFPGAAPLECATPELDPAYAALAGKVKQAAAALQATYPSVGVDKIDPLIVHSGKPEVFGKLKAADDGKAHRQSPDAVDFRYQAAFALTIDGTNQPTVTGDLQVESVAMGAVAPTTAASALKAKPADPDPVLRTSPALGTVSPRSAPAAQTGPTPSWNAAGQQATMAPPPTSARVQSTTVPATTVPAAAAAATAVNHATIQKDLAAASCTSPSGGMRFNCTTRAGFDRCESLRRERRVDQCTLDVKR